MPEVKRCDKQAVDGRRLHRVGCWLSQRIYQYGGKRGDPRKTQYRDRPLISSRHRLGATTRVMLLRRLTDQRPMKQHLFK
jgi:hypothetical protein